MTQKPWSSGLKGTFAASMFALTTMAFPAFGATPTTVSEFNTKATSGQTAAQKPCQIYKPGEKPQAPGLDDSWCPVLVLGVTLDNNLQPVGIVTFVDLLVEKREDKDGLRILFLEYPGRFSPYAQEAIKKGIQEAINFLHREDIISPDAPTDSLTLVVTFPSRGLTMYGDSLSATVSVHFALMIAKALGAEQGKYMKTCRALTGAIGEKGAINAVGGIPYKVYAGAINRIPHILIPEEPSQTDDPYQNPDFMRVSFVKGLKGAYTMMTDPCNKTQITEVILPLPNPPQSLQPLHAY